MCRSQGYDNAANMAGIHGGVQAIIKAINPKTVFNGCVDHSLNLCGQHSFAESPECVTFFANVESLYTFFSASTHRRDILKKHTGVTLKRLSTTRWSAHRNAVLPICEKYDEVIEALELLCRVGENIDTRGAAQINLKSICDFSFVGFLFLWSSVLVEVDNT